MPYTQIVDGRVQWPGVGERIDEPTSSVCRSGPVEIYDPDYPPTGLAYERIAPTGQTVRAFSKFTEVLPPGRHVTIGLRPDGRWTILAHFPDPEPEE